MARRHARLIGGIVATCLVAVGFIVLRQNRNFQAESQEGEAKPVNDDFQPEVVAEVHAARARREAVRTQYPCLFENLRQCLFKHDPISINFGDNIDEYDAEVGTIIPRLPACTSEADVAKVVHEEFVAWFDADIAGPQAKYSKLAADVWRLWQGQLAQGSTSDGETQKRGSDGAWPASGKP